MTAHGGLIGFASSSGLDDPALPGVRRFAVVAVIAMPGGGYSVHWSVMTPEHAVSEVPEACPACDAAVDPEAAAAASFSRTRHHVMVAASPSEVADLLGDSVLAREALERCAASDPLFAPAGASAAA